MSCRRMATSLIERTCGAKVEVHFRQRFSQVIFTLGFKHILNQGVNLYSNASLFMRCGTHPV